MNKRATVAAQPKTEGARNRRPDAKVGPTCGLGKDHPLNDIIGTHSGPVWESIRKDIEANRKRTDREYAKDSS
jgi:hypothetical protein